MHGLYNLAASQLHFRDIKVFTIIGLKCQISNIDTLSMVLIGPMSSYKYEYIRKCFGELYTNYGFGCKKNTSFNRLTELRNCNSCRSWSRKLAANIFGNLIIVNQQTVHISKSFQAKSEIGGEFEPLFKSGRLV
jgi:hypothetical protein